MSNLVLCLVLARGGVVSLLRKQERTTRESQMASEGMNSAFIDAAAKALEKGAELTQGEADAVMSLAYMCNPDGNGYVKIWKRDVAKIAPHIEIRD